MAIPLSVFAGIYALVILIAAVVGISYFGLALRYGMRRSVTTLVTVIVAALFVLVVTVTYAALRDVDWTTPLNISVPGLSKSSQI